MFIRRRDWTASVCSPHRTRGPGGVIWCPYRRIRSSLRRWPPCFGGGFCQRSSGSVIGLCSRNATMRCRPGICFMTPAPPMRWASHGFDWRRAIFTGLVWTTSDPETADHYAARHDPISFCRRPQCRSVVVVRAPADVCGLRRSEAKRVSTPGRPGSLFTPPMLLLLLLSTSMMGLLRKIRA